MKKRTLITRLRSMAMERGGDVELVRQGGNDEIWRVGADRLIIPRHREINERTAHAILAVARRALEKGSR